MILPGISFNIIRYSDRHGWSLSGVLKFFVSVKTPEQFQKLPCPGHSRPVLVSEAGGLPGKNGLLILPRSQDWGPWSSQQGSGPAGVFVVSLNSHLRLGQICALISSRLKGEAGPCSGASLPSVVDLVAGNRMTHQLDSPASGRVTREVRALTSPPSPLTPPLTAARSPQHAGPGLVLSKLVFR